MFADDYAHIVTHLDVLLDKADNDIEIYSAHLTLSRHSNNSTDLEILDSNIGANRVLLLYEILPGNMSRLMMSEVVSLAQKSKQLKLDIKAIVSNWKREVYSSQRRVVEIRTVGTTQLNLIFAQSTTDIQTLDVCTYSKKSSDVRSRSRRSTKSPKKCEGGKCCRHPVKIKYADLGLYIEDVHVVDETFTAYICSGKCRRTSKTFTNYSNIKKLLYIMTKDKRFKNRCVPKSFEKGFKLFHFDEHDVLALSEFDDIIVKDCACT